MTAGYNIIIQGGQSENSFGYRHDRLCTGAGDHPVFTDCESHGKMLTTADGRSVSMKCHWAGVAEVAAAIPLALAGTYALAAQSAQGNAAFRWSRGRGIGP